jgi:hypothetical protein
MKIIKTITENFVSNSILSTLNFSVTRHNLICMLSELQYVKHHYYAYLCHYLIDNDI